MSKELRKHAASAGWQGGEKQKHSAKEAFPVTSQAQTIVGSTQASSSQGSSEAARYNLRSKEGG